MARIAVPCRSTVCSHNQCFDVATYLELQDQAPTWSCPSCNKSLTYDALVIDDYVSDILQQTSRDVEQVVIEPNGKWRPLKYGEDPNRRPDHSSTSKSQPARGMADDDDDDDDDDLVMYDPKSRLENVKKEPQTGTPNIAQHTPPLSSREASTSNMSAQRASHGPSSGKKRQSAVIDLTLSDDEEDEPPRPAKRVNSTRSIPYQTPPITDPRSNQLPNRPSSFFDSNSQNGNKTPLPGLQYQQPPPPPQAPPQLSNGNASGGQRLPWGARTGSYFSPWKDRPWDLSESSTPPSGP